MQGICYQICNILMHYRLMNKYCIKKKKYCIAGTQDNGNKDAWMQLHFY